MSEDTKLLAEYRASRSPEVFARVVGRHAGIVYGVALRITGNAHDAEDVAQECFLSLARDARTEPRLLSAWLHRLAVNRALNLVRGRQRRQRHETAAARQKPGHVRDEPTWEDIAPYVDEAMDELPEDLRQALVLRFLHEHTQDEIGARLNVDRSNVSRRIEKGLDLLRSNLRRLGVTVTTAALLPLLQKNVARAAPSLLAATILRHVAETTAAKGAAAVTAWSAAKILLSIGLAAAILLSVSALARGRNANQPAKGGAAAVVPAKPSPDRGSPRLADARVVFPPDDLAWLGMRTSRYWLQVRLTPDNRFLLYYRPDDGQPGADAESFRLVFRDLESGMDRPAPVPPYPRAYRTAHTRYNPCDPKSAHAALLAVHEGQNMEIVLCDLATGAASRTGITGPMVFGLFECTGSHLIAAVGRTMIRFDVATGEREDLHLGWAWARYPQSVCPTEDVVCFFGLDPPKEAAPEAAPAPPQGSGPAAILAQRAQRPRPTDALRLCHIPDGALVASLPVHEKNSQLDDIASVWTPDGRFICYLDLTDTEEGTEEGTRIWDRMLGREHRFIAGTAPVGPGPDPQSVFLIQLVEGDCRPVLYDAARDRTWVVGDVGIRLLHANGDKVVYLQTAPDGTQAVYIATLAFR